MLCPKGLSEHHTINTDNRAKYPLLRRGGTMQRVSWDDALTTMAARFRDIQARHGAGAVGVISTGQLVTEEFYALGKLVQLGLGTRTTTATPRCACPQRCRATSDRLAAMGLRARTKTSNAPTSSSSSAPTSPRTTRFSAGGCESNPNATDHRHRSARHQDGDDGRSAPAAAPALGSRAHQRPDSHRHRTQPDRSRVHRRAYDRVRSAARVGARATRRSAWPRSPA